MMRVHQCIGGSEQSTAHADLKTPTTQTSAISVDSPYFLFPSLPHSVTSARRVWWYCRQLLLLLYCCDACTSACRHAPDLEMCSLSKCS